MKYTLVLLLFWSVQFLWSQPAPDFTVEDTEGNTHSLYADYLDKDFTVVIKIFFSSCPPCRAIAPDVQQLYEKWGSGADGVQFIELSDKSWDDNTRVKNYKSDFGLTMPTVGAQGGSLEALEPYLDGTYGVFTGTPLFVLINAQKEVRYDISGLNNAQTIELLDQAIAESRQTIVPDTLLNISLSSIEGMPVQSYPYELLLTPKPTAPQGTASHRFELETGTSGQLLLVTDVVEHPEYYSGVLAYLDPRGHSTGVSTLDLIRMQRFVLGLEDFDQEILELASDFNYDGAVSLLDLIGFQGVVLGLIQLEENYIIQNDCLRLSLPFDFELLQNAQCNKNFTIHKRGDVIGF